jgi:NAD(P) transhydrogenase subunit alpha
MSTLKGLCQLLAPVGEKTGPPPFQGWHSLPRLPGVAPSSQRGINCFGIIDLSKMQRQPADTRPSWNLKPLCSLIFALSIFSFSASAATDEAVLASNASESSFDFVSALFVFMLATFVGLDVIRRVSRLLHTPLMSLTNAISAIAVVGAILVAGPEHPPVIHWMGLVAVVASVTNIVSGFLITDRMLKMFKKKEEIKAK